MYVAVIDAWYRVLGLGESEDEAIAAACKEYRAAIRRGTLLVVHVDGRTVKRNADIQDYFGVKVYGPMLPGEGVTE